MKTMITLIFTALLFAQASFACDMNDKQNHIKIFKHLQDKAREQIKLLKKNKTEPARGFRNYRQVVDMQTFRPNPKTFAWFSIEYTTTESPVTQEIHKFIVQADCSLKRIDQIMLYPMNLN